MKNLKRILSLALASVMVMGMMVVGASAANFVDEGDITASHKNAILTLNALGIMNGKEGGKLDPKGTLTRAEMATMIATVLNRGTAPNFGVKNTPTFTDIDNHWGESFIEYVCSVKSNDVKIMNGVGGGKFSPDATLTATTAARTILNAMGYTIDDPSNWELLTETQARQEDINLYAGLSAITDPSHHYITREQFAHMLNNALDADMEGNATQKVSVPVTEKKWVITLKAGHGYGDTVVAAIEAMNEAGFTSYNDAKVWMVDNASDTGNAQMGTKYSIGQDDVVVGSTTVDAPESLGHKFLGLKTYAGTMTSVVYDEDYDTYTTAVAGQGNFDADEDFSALMGQNVKVVVRENDNGVVTKVYGITANKGSVLFTGTIGDIAPMTGTTIAAAAKSIKVNGKEYKLNDKNTDGTTIATPASSLNFYAYNAAGTSGNLTSFSGISNACTMKGIDTNGDGKLDRIEYLPVEVVTVTNVTAKAITTNPKVTGEASAVLSTEADTLAVKAYEGIKRNDIVVATPAANTVSGKVELAKAEIVTGVAADAARSATKEVRIDGKWTKVLANADYTALAGLSTTTTYDVVMVNGYIAKATVAQSASTASKDLLIVTAKAAAPNLDGETEFRAALMDGTTVTGYGKLAPSGSFDIHGVYTYTVKDGKYTLRAVSASNKAGFDSVIAQAAGFTPANTSAGTESPAKIASLPIADDATIVVRYDSTANTAENNTEDTAFGTTKTLYATAVLTGAEVKKWAQPLAGATNSGNTSNVVFTETVNGITYVKAAILFTAKTSLPNLGAIGQNIGYVVSDAYAIADYMVYDIWDGEDTITVKDENASAPAKGTVIKYADKGDGIIDTSATGMGVVSPDKTAAVVGYDKGNLNVIATDGAAVNDLVVDEKTLILYVDAANVAGQTTGSIVNATEDGATPGQYIANVSYKLGTAYSGKHVDILVVDVNNNILNADTSNVDYTAAVTIKNLAADTNWDVVSVTYNGVTYAKTDLATAGDNEDGILTVKKGATVTVTVKATTAGAAQEKGCDIKSSGSSVGEIATLTTGTQGTANKNIRVTVNGDMDLTLADKS